MSNMPKLTKIKILNVSLGNLFLPTDPTYKKASLLKSLKSLEDLM